MEKFKELYSQLNAEQKQAVDLVDGPLLVIAGPGTGKTQLLTLRVANILLKTDAQAHNILCLTFTESAAHEMRQRLVNIIGLKAYDITISTYHAFGSEIITRHGEYFADNNSLQPIDELGIHEIMTSIVERLPYDNALKKSQYYIRDVIGTVSDYKRATLSPQDLRQIATANLTWARQTNKMTQIALHDMKRLSMKQLGAFEELATQTSNVKTIPVIEGIVSLQSQWQETLETALEDSREQNNTKPLTSWKNSWLERDAAGQYIVKGEKENKKLLALADIYQEYLTVLKERQLYDYDDMILRANRGLQENKSLRFSLQEQYNYILLDEFQDTNAAQLQLVSLLSDSPIHEGQPNVMAVGDDDQAIYAFQGADYSHMLAFQELYRNVKTICLTKNYRSHKDILEVGHNITEQIEERLTDSQDEISKILRAENMLLPEKSIVERHEFKSDVAQYGWVAKQVTNLIGSGVSPNEIAILAPQHRYLEPAVNYLKQAQIPLHYEKRENILDDPHVLQLTHMAELVLALGNLEQETANVLWPEILSYDFFDYNPATIWQLSWQSADGHKSWTEVLLASREFKQMASFFLKLSQLSKTETLETMIDYLVGVTPLKIKTKISYTSPFYTYNFNAKKRDAETSDFWNLLTNLTVLRQHLRDNIRNHREQSTLQDLVTFVDSHNNANIKVLNTSPYHESSNAVQLMTAYKAKGQEFTYVFLLACVDEVWGSKAMNQSAKIALPKNLNFVRYQGASEDERRRLFYVAITRAKLGLYLTSFVSNYAGKPTTRLKYLNEIDNGESIISQTLPVHSQRVIKNETESPDINELDAYWHQKHITALKNPDLRDILKPRLDKYQLAPTHLNSFTDIIHGGPEYFLLNTILRFPKAIGVDAEFGNAIHATLEWIHVKQIENDKLPTIREILAFYNDYLQRMPLAKNEHEQLIRRGETCLASYLKAQGDSFSKDHIHEMNFKNQGVFVGDAHLSGKIDKLIVDKGTKEITIVDYKTGKSASRWKFNDPKLHKYKQQLYIYKLLVEGSYQFADYRVKDAYLEFVEPNENGEIVQLHISFDTKEMQRIKQLIIAMWKLIKKLQVPDISSYPQNYQGVVSFEEDLIKE